MLSEGAIENLPVNGRSKALDQVVFGRFGLVSHKNTAGKPFDPDDLGQKPSMDKEVLEVWLNTLEPDTVEHAFVRNLRLRAERLGKFVGPAFHGHVRELRFPLGEEGLQFEQSVMVLDHGEKISEGLPSQVASDPRVVEVYLGTDAHATQAVAAQAGR